MYLAKNWLDAFGGHRNRSKREVTSKESDKIVACPPLPNCTDDRAQRARAAKRRTSPAISGCVVAHFSTEQRLTTGNEPEFA